MALIALFLPDSHAWARLVDAVGDEHELLRCESWSTLWESAVRRPVAGSIVDPYNSFDPVALPELLHFRRRFSSQALVVYGDFAGRELDLYHLGRLGVDGVILAGRDESRRRLRDRVEVALSCSLAKRVADALGGVLPELGIRCLRWAIEHADENAQVPDLARAVRMSPRALSRELRALGLSAPRHLLLWGRLFQAARMLDATDVTVEEVAFRLGYATGASLGRAFREQAGVSPTELVGRDGGVDRVLAAFITSMRDESDEAEDDDGPRRWSTSEVRRAVLRSFLSP